VSFAIPAANHEDVPALDVLAMLAGQGETSRLYRQVKRDGGW
jgi:zinc protease